ncbi:HlyD family secretion protein [Radicibacter daui]|uniref:HlyD family secretion protein n=1 Tax=Radicibacter daui TaxID=3064829 RepID=UPI004046FCD9
MSDQQGAGGKGSSRRRLILSVVLAVIVIGGGLLWWLGHGKEDTDDAFTEGNVVDLRPLVGGTVLAVHITDNQQVKKGDVLAEIDPADYLIARDTAQASELSAEAALVKAQANLSLIEITTDASLAEAQHNVDVAEASLAQTKADVTAASAVAGQTARDAKRYQELSVTSAASKQKLDSADADARSAAARLVAANSAVKAGEAQVAVARAQLRSAQTSEQQIALAQAEVKAAQAQVKSSKAALDKAELDLQRTTITAPEDGVITNRQINPGDVVSAGQKVSAFVVGTPWVVANFKETQLTDMRPGQPVEIEIDAYPGKKYAGHVDSIQRGSGPYFSLLPPENATGNFVKVVQRVPVKIVFDELPEQPLGLGFSVAPVVDVSVDPQRK